MPSSDWIDAITGLPSAKKLVLGIALTALAIELVLRRFPNSSAFSAWKRAVEALGSVWTAILLTLIYCLVVGPVSLALRSIGRVPQERSFRTGATSWRPHEKSPFAPRRAVRHQF